MNTKLILPRARIERMARKAARLLSFAHTIAGTIPDELGTTLAEPNANSAMHDAAEAMALLARIELSLQVERKAAELDALAHKLAPHEMDALATIARQGGTTGFDIFDQQLATTLRSIERRAPELIILCAVDAHPSGAKPILGGVLKAKGRELVEWVKGGAM